LVLFFQHCQKFAQYYYVMHMMQIEKPDVTYKEVVGCKKQIEKLKEVVEMPLLNLEHFVNLGI